jgi:hypothetical protein
LEGYDVQDVANSEFKKVVITFNVEGEFIESVVNYLDKKHLRTSESGYLADAALNRLILTVNPLWGVATTKGTVQFSSGFDYSVDNKDFKVDIGAGDVTVTVDDDATGDQDDVVTAVNSALTDAALNASVVAFNGVSGIGIRRVQSGSTTTLKLTSGVSDDFLAQAGITAATYTGDYAIDSVFEGQSETLTFYTKLNPYFPTETAESETENIDGIEIPVYDNTFRYLELDFILDDLTAIYGTFTDLQAFDYYVGKTWYKDSSGNPKGEKITLYTATDYEGLEMVSVEKIENDSLVNLGIRRVKMKINQLQNYRFRPQL